VEDEMSEPIKLYRNGETIETCAPSVARAWQAQGWSLTPDMMPNAAPIELPEVEPEPVQRKPGRPKKGG